MVNNETKWMLRALIALAKRKLADANDSRESEGDWPAGQEWHEIGNTSQHAFMNAAREEAGIPHAEYRELIEDVAAADDLCDLDAIWADMERPNVPGEGLADGADGRQSSREAAASTWLLGAADNGERN